MDQRDVIPLGQPADRRSFLGALLGVATAGVAAVLAIPLVRFGLHPLWRATSEVP